MGREFSVMSTGQEGEFAVFRYPDCAGYFSVDPDGVTYRVTGRYVNVAESDDVIEDAAEAHKRARRGRTTG